MSRKSISFAAAILICCVHAYAQNDPNLVGYWNFDEGAVTDLSGNGNNGTLLGRAALSDAPDFVYGGSGFSLDLNYQNRDTDRVEIPHSDSLNITRGLTFLAWIRPDDIENTDGIVTKGTTRASWALRFHATNGLRFTANAGFNLEDPNDPSFAPGALGTIDRQSVFEVPEVNVPAGIDWSFVGVISDTQSLRFILNLQEETLPAAYVFAECNEPLVLGGYPPGGMYFNGLMDEVRIYSRALSRREVIALSGLAEKPFEPAPVDGAAGVTSATLTWGRIGGTDKVYLGTDASALALVSADAAGSYTLTEAVPGRQYFWRVDVATTDTVVTGDLWSFTVAENAASGPNPSDGAEFVGVDGLSLRWLPAWGATAYDVYYGMNPNALGLLGRVTGTSYADPDKTLPSETLHYWRIDAVKDAEAVAGPVWSFKTMPVFVVEPNLAAWYKFELGEGTRAVDWTRKGNDGVLVGDARWSDDGYAGRALQLDGAADYVEIPRVVQDDWTIMLWLRTDNLQQSRSGQLGNLARVRHGAGLIDGDSGGQTENFALALNGDRIVANCTAESQGDGGALASNARIRAANWHHVAWTHRAVSGAMALFIDGAPDNSGQSDKWKGAKDAQDFVWIGGLQYGMSQQYFEGMIDEVKFFTRVLNEDEIRNEMRPDKRLAFSPQPTPGTVWNQEKPVTLAWIPGDAATTHTVYLGASLDSLPLVRAAQDANGYHAGLLAPATYYWQIGEIQPDGAEVKGDVWNFVVAEYLLVDDFESYGNTDPIYETWIDGFDPVAGNGSGAVVGHDVWDPLSPYYQGDIVETTIVHEGRQSMPLYYHNDGSQNNAFYSEATRTLDPVQDWTRKGVHSLTLWFRGAPGNAAGQLYVALADSANHGATVKHPNAAATVTDTWQEWNIDLAQFTGVNLTAVKKISIGVGDRVAPQASGSGKLYIDDIRLYRP